ncbi:TM2 domain containing 1 [Podarcis lilfordi]|uniref:TM2 domain containing 1 n=1 Tax=Podarcis lilfordi TaxID=74358 RepID=A0AA35KEU9_9SAUR|nr:TM2 domain containing 1 [Podarcis lilfordi]
MAAWQEMPLSGNKRKKGGVIVLWSLGTLCLACLAAQGAAGGDPSLKCEDLRVGQYPEAARRQRLVAMVMGLAMDPKIDNETQEPLNCTNHTAYVACLPAPNITCKNLFGNETQFTGKEIGFYKPIECRNVNGYSYKVAVALSLFLGWLGADRFYLGYPALGLLKFCTVGFCGIGSLIDFILISMQIVGPSDGSSYIIDYYGKTTNIPLNMPSSAEQ